MFSFQSIWDHDPTCFFLARIEQQTRNETAMTSMNDWHSSRDLARVWGLQTVNISAKWFVRIFSAVPVFGEDETYIALLVEHNGDAWSDRAPFAWTRF